MDIKNVIVAGTGKSGISAAKLLLKHGANVYLFDENETRNKDEIMAQTGNSPCCRIVLGTLTDEVLDAAELMVISPGIPVDAPFTEAVRAEKHSDLERDRACVQLRKRQNRCHNGNKWKDNDNFSCRRNHENL